MNNIPSIMDKQPSVLLIYTSSSEQAIYPSSSFTVDEEVCVWPVLPELREVSTGQCSWIISWDGTAVFSSRYILKQSQKGMMQFCSALTSTGKGCFGLTRSLQEVCIGCCAFTTQSLPPTPKPSATENGGTSINPKPPTVEPAAATQ